MEQAVYTWIVILVSLHYKTNHLQTHDTHFPIKQTIYMHMTPIYLDSITDLSNISFTTRSYGSWIYNCRCNQCPSPLMLRVRISIRARCTTLCDKVCQWLVTGRWFSPDTPVSSTNKTDRHDITEILLKVALITIKQTNQPIIRNTRM